MKPSVTLILFTAPIHTTRQVESGSNPSFPLSVAVCESCVWYTSLCLLTYEAEKLSFLECDSRYYDTDFICVNSNNKNHSSKCFFLGVILTFFWNGAVVCLDLLIELLRCCLGACVEYFQREKSLKMSSSLCLSVRDELKYAVCRYVLLYNIIYKWFERNEILTSMLLFFCWCCCRRSHDVINETVWHSYYWKCGR